MTAVSTTIRWDGAVPTRAASTLAAPGGLVVCATKGRLYSHDDRHGPGLEREFAAKQRNRNKPGVILCSSIEQLTELAELDDEILTFYLTHRDSDIPLGYILPRREEALRLIPDATTAALVRDRRGTSCFVTKFGWPAEQLARMMWQSWTLIFASSAKPPGFGNRGRVEGIGQRIELKADLIITAASMQSRETAGTRHEQGVMVSMVDESAKLVPIQCGRRSVLQCPTLIRRWLDCDRNMENCPGITDRAPTINYQTNILARSSSSRPLKVVAGARVGAEPLRSTIMLRSALAA